MMESNAIRWVCALLLSSCMALAGWQYTAHQEAREGLRDELHDRSEDIARAIALVIRAEGRFDAVSQSRVNAVLQELTASTNLLSVSLRDIAGNEVAKAGPDLSVSIEDYAQEGAYWGSESAVFLNLVALGGVPDENHDRRGGGPPGPDHGPDHGPDRRPPPNHDGRGGPDGGEGPPDRRREGPPNPQDGLRAYMDGQPLTDERLEELIALFPGPPMSEETRDALTTLFRGKQLTPDLLAQARPLLRNTGMDRSRRGGPGPRWERMGPDDLLDKRGIHAFVIEVPASEVYTAESSDFRMRILLVATFGGVCLAIFFLFQTTRRSALLGVQLAHSEAMTTHLQELNVAAAGLVHETKNPLNVIRGLAQMIGREEATALEKRGPALRIMDEADRVAGRLNQFLEYSRPLAPKLNRVEILPLVEDLFSVLDQDREEKHIAFIYRVGGPETIRADSDMLRQVLFNLLINAIEAVEPHGKIEVMTGQGTGATAWIEVRDNGPGVAEALRPSLFQPYVTGTESGTGLGLTIVRQIVLAHNWTVTCNDAQDGGTVFRIAGIEVN